MGGRRRTTIRRRRPALIGACLALTVAPLAACGDGAERATTDRAVTLEAEPGADAAAEATEPETPDENDRRTAPPEGPVPDPDSITVLIDRERFLSEDHVPPDLVEAPVEWAPSDDTERRLLRAEAAEHLVELFAAAADEGEPLLGVSGYRSHRRQAMVHEHAVETSENGDGARYSAEAGHSEHQTGLAVDVTGGNATCMLEPCFAVTSTAHWLLENVHRFGFVVRYPSGKEEITGYAHEPWHLRYVGPELAAELHEAGLTLDEWYRVER